MEAAGRPVQGDARAGPRRVSPSCAALTRLAHAAGRRLSALAPPPRSGSSQDYIRAPKPNGYRALHTTLQLDESGYLVEVQLRGRAMHESAERGGAAHHLYKAQLSGQQKLLGQQAPPAQQARSLLPAAGGGS